MGVRLNHLIDHKKNNCVLNINGGNEKTRSWTAIDYSDDTAKVSTFCVRLQKPEHATEFHDIFEKVKSSNGAEKKTTFEIVDESETPLSPLKNGEGDNKKEEVEDDKKAKEN